MKQYQLALFGLVTIGVLMTTSCKHRPTNFVVKGNLTGLPVKKVYLTSISFDNKPVLILDSATLKEGKFELRGPGAEEALYRVMLGDPSNGPWMGVIDDNAEITLSMDGSQDGNYSVKGSPASERFHILFDSLHVLLDNIQKDRMAATGNQDPSGSAAQTPAADTAAVSADAENQVKNFYGYLAQTVKEDPSPVIASFALNFYGIGATEEAAANYGVYTPNYDVAILSGLAQDLKKKFPSSTSVASTAEAVQKTLDVPRVGSIAPDLSLPDTSGKAFAISSLRGKFVLVDFWASWCDPCRAENPNVVKAYAQFKDKNFAIVGVSLDQKKDLWLSAIHDDGLAWTQISDLAFWQSKAVETFQFTSIPYNILLDPQGRIIATSLRGDALEEKLTEVLH